MKESEKYKEDSKRFSEITDHTVKCKCGCSVVFGNRKERVICRWCSNYVYKTPQLEFRYKMEEKKRKKKK